MDIELARTFLAILETGSFVDAAERLNVTQSTVSARVKSLEQQIGQQVFVRNKSGATPTGAGLRFRRHAMGLLRVWENARQEIALPESFRAMLSAGGQISLWEDFLSAWLDTTRAKHPDVAVRAEAADNDGLMRQLVDGLLDFAVLYHPQSRAGLKVEELFEESLVPVATEPARALPADSGYVLVNWGPEFEAAHAMAFPEFTAPNLVIGVGGIALDFILRNGGSGYFPYRMVDRHIADGRLHLIRDAPRFARPAYLVHGVDPENEALATALDEIRDQARKVKRLNAASRSA